MIAGLAHVIVLYLNVNAYGVPGTGTIALDTQRGRFARRFDAGPASEYEAFDGRIAWRADATGMPRTQGNTGERGEILQWSHALQNAVRSCPSRAYLAGSTDHVTVLFNECRTISGVRVPTHIVYKSEQNGVWTATVRDVRSLAKIPLKAFVPAPNPHDFQLAAITRVPIATTQGVPELTVRVNGKPLHFVLDTGGQNLLSEKAARLVGVQAVGHGIVSGGGGGIVPIRYGFADSVEVGAATMRHQPFIILPASLPYGIDGLVGYELLARFPARLDLRHNMLELAPRAAAFGRSVAPVRFDYFDRQPEVQGALDDVTGAFSIDTGSNLTAEVQAPAVVRYDLIAKLHATVTAQAADVGTRYPIYVVRAGALKLGSATFPKPIVSLMSPANRQKNKTTIANVGDGILGHWVVVFDYPRQRIDFRPGGSAAPTMVRDHSGIVLGADAKGLIAAQVLGGTPAAESGVKQGLKIVAIDGKPVGPRDYTRVQTILRGDPGTRVRLTLADRSVHTFSLRKYL